jgi:cytochrome c551/c552
VTRARAIAVLLLGAALVAGGSGTVVRAEAAGDPARGRAVFAEEGCARCHFPPGQGRGMGPPIEEISRPQGALHLAGRLWNHAPAMFAALKQEGAKWPELTPERMADLMAYLQADPSRDAPPDPFQGQVMLLRKGCLKCHRLRGEGGSIALELTKYQGRYESAVVWATTIWNHSPRMAAHAAGTGVLYPRFTGDEMGNLVEFLRRATSVAPR